MPNAFWRSPESDRFINPREDVALRHVKLYAVEPVLDFGCGNGRLSTHFTHYTGVDISERRIAQARSAHPMMPDERFRTIDRASDLRGQSATVIADNVLLHIPDSEIMDTIRALCRTAGISVVQVESFGRWRREDMKCWRHSFPRDLDDYEQMFGECGFSGGRVTEITPSPASGIRHNVHVVEWVREWET